MALGPRFKMLTLIAKEALIKLSILWPCAAHTQRYVDCGAVRASSQRRKAAPRARISACPSRVSGVHSSSASVLTCSTQTPLSHGALSCRACTTRDAGNTTCRTSGNSHPEQVITQVSVLSLRRGSRMPQPRAHQREVDSWKGCLVVAERAALIARVAPQVLPALLPRNERRAARGRHGRVRRLPALQAPDEPG
jgi:hypothetical protein